MDEQLSLEKKRDRIKAFKGFAAAFILFSVIMFILFLPFVQIPNKSYLTKDNYNKIENNMTYSQVVSVLGGHEGELQSTANTGMYTIVYYQWSNKEGTRVIIVSFLNGLVSNKSQIGLS